MFENLVINEVVKRDFNKGVTPEITFWRDSTGNEIDLIDYENGGRKAYEIKSGQTFSSDYFKGLIKWSALSKNSVNHNFVVYNGDRQYNTSNGIVVPWEKFGNKEDL